MAKRPSKSREGQIIREIFAKHRRGAERTFLFERDEIHKAADDLGVARLDNPYSLVYNLRHRGMPADIAALAEPGMEWIIIGDPEISTSYRIKQAPITRISPDTSLVPITLPDATPRLLTDHVFGETQDEQAVLAMVRYNRLVDLFLGIVAHSIQNHLRTRVKRVQLEVDEIYVGVNRLGELCIVPIQAKVGRSRFGRVQLEQDLAFCRERFRSYRARAVAVQALSREHLVLYELAIVEDHVVKIQELHCLVQRKPLTRTQDS